MPELMYHQRTFELLRRPPVTSPATIRALSVVEERCGGPLPAAVREWYELDGAVELLGEYSNDDRPVPLADLGTDFVDSRRNSVSTVAESLLAMLHECQGVCAWAVRLDSGDDPPVLVRFGNGDPRWQLHADTFSTFVYTRIWDFLSWPLPIQRQCGLEAQDGALSPQDLAFLRAHFAEGPRTYIWPARTSYRFSRGDQRVLIWDDEETQADWWLWADTEESLRALAERVWKLGSLAETLYDFSPCGKQVLQAFRA
jgi:hypothetical protein